MQKDGFNFDYIYGFEGGFAVIYKDGKQGAINAKGEVASPCEYGQVARAGQILKSKTAANTL